MPFLLPNDLLVTVAWDYDGRIVEITETPDFHEIGHRRNIAYIWNPNVREADLPSWVEEVVYSDSKK